ncbi:hypothetical protein CPB83DRAFT_647159 [Crepidotus variabilis]|uniref:Cep57 centrosome microtubule-binding domain-containing protein n=1 Tax=Crepidotus variabilis TaxID=179855 RepID=A0A9P6JKL8_9AGAR|nr:hypothetical protein CPB83DRAFT_647159 [Crepidotus variabilis]
MKGRSAGISFEIQGDEQEHHRIQLEHNLQNTELSFHISTDDDEERPRRKNYDSSVEYPRHLSEPSLLDMPSFVHRSRDHFSAGDEEQSHLVHAWSYRTGDDDEGINPYAGGETMSTFAHHASGVTISAGLGAGRGARPREPSFSGAEYDPDRPLHAMIAGVNSKHSMFDIDPSKSKHQMTFDPVVVDSTAELDRLLESGHAPPTNAQSLHSRSVRLNSPPESPVSSDSEITPQQHEMQNSSRPRLTDHLRHVSFSPKRPRTAQGVVPTSPAPRSKRQLADDTRNVSTNMPTPRPVRRAASTPAKPEVRLQPATPSTTGSKFSRMKKGLSKEIEAEKVHQEKEAANRQRQRLGPSSLGRTMSAPQDQNPFHDEPTPMTQRMPTPRKSSMRDTTKSRVYLPDVTGLTNAVESPLRPGTRYYAYRGERPRDGEARLFQTLATVQAQLQDLEEENSISRRRVNELELELEECKREVARERTRLFDRDNSRSFQQEQSYRAPGLSKAKGKSKAKDNSFVGGLAELDDERLKARYKEAVDEKKALEALVNSLRSHLTRLTAELSAHQELLTELRTLREQDARALREKGNEILVLQEEVQRLAGEVEVLRGVVEEGLKERRASKENIEVEVEKHEADIGMSQDLHQIQVEDAAAAEVDEDLSELDEESEPDTVDFDPPLNNADKTMRTDRATLGESTNSKGLDIEPMPEDFQKIVNEIEERRSNRSNDSMRSRASRSPSPLRRGEKKRTKGLDDLRQEDDERSVSAPRSPQPSSSRPVAPTPSQAARQYTRKLDDIEPETPFPRIRGEHLEKLFFSAPEHNAKTCTVCYRRRNRPHEMASPWSKAAFNTQHRPNREQATQDDEGYCGSEGVDDQKVGHDKGKQREHVVFSTDPSHWQAAGAKHGLPPQTMLTRVIRELEDDFTHYKSVYVELADQYKVMDAVSDVPRRRLLAQHLREVVDLLEQKGDQIASLYDLLSFKDKPVPESLFTQ